MGFDNECILNIQSLPGEYFCPVCRTLVFPNEALQAQCTHLYCKPCLAYVVATTRACPYDGYLVTEADAKPLTESNKLISEAIEKIQVHCLYHRSGCQWQGSLTECISHCTSCTYGNSPVVCNRCGTQIVHRQVQEHAQICPGVQPQQQQAGTAQPQASVEQNQVAAQPGAQATQHQPVQANATPNTTLSSTSMNAVAPSSASAAVPAAVATVPGQAMPVSQPQAVAQTPTPEQWYQQQQQQQLQYQQYYQQYPGYDPYQQQTQYQQQAYLQYQQPNMQPYPQATQAAQQPLAYAQTQPQTVPQPQQLQQSQPQQLQPQPVSQPQIQGQPQPQVHPYAHTPQMQVPANQHALAPAQQPQPQMQPQANLPSQMQVVAPQPGNLHPQAHLPVQPLQAQASLHPQHQQLMPQQHPSNQLQQPATHSQPHAQPQPQPQPQPQAMPHPQFQQYSQVQMQQPSHQQSHPQGLQQVHPPAHSMPQQPTAHAVTGHLSYPQPQQSQQMLPGPPQQRPAYIQPLQQGVPHQLPQHPVQMHAQPPSHQQQMRPTQSLPSVQAQHATVPQSQMGPHASQPSVQKQAQQYPGMHPPVQHHGMPPQMGRSQVPPQQGSFPSHNAGMPHATHLQGSTHMQQHPPMHPQLQQNASVSQGMPTLAGQGMVPSATASQGVPVGGSPAPSRPGKMDQNVSKIDGGSEVKGVSGGSIATNNLADLSGSNDQKQDTDLKQQINLENGMVDGLKEDRIMESSANQTGKEEQAEKPLEQSEGASAEFTECGENKPEKSSQAAGEEDGVAEKAVVANTEGNGPDISKVPPHTSMSTPVISHSFSRGSETAVQTPTPPGMSGAQLPSNQDQAPSTLPHPDSAKGEQRHPGALPSEKYQNQMVPYGPTDMQQVGTQRPSAPERMPRQTTLQVGPDHDRRFQEPQQPYSMSAPGPALMRGSGPGFTEHMPPAGPFHSQQQSGGFSDPGSQRGPTQLPVQKMFEPPTVATQLPPQGQLPPHQGQLPPPQGLPPLQGQLPLPQGQLPPPQAVGPRMHGPLPGPPVGGPPSASFDSREAMMTRGAIPFHDSQMNMVRPPYPIPDDNFSTKMPGSYDNRQPDLCPPLPMEYGSAGQFSRPSPSIAKANGVPAKLLDLPSHGPIPDRFQGFRDERYKALADEGFKPPSDERFRPFSVDPMRRMRDFEEDLKQFPRQDGEGISKMDGYSRPLDRGPHFWGPDSGSRPFEKTMKPFGKDAGPNFDAHSGVMSSRASDGIFGDKNIRDDIPKRSDFGHFDNHPFGIGGRDLPDLSSKRFDSNPSRFKDHSGDQVMFGERSRSLGIHSEAFGNMTHGSRLPVPSAPFDASETSRMIEQFGSDAPKIAQLEGSDFMTSKPRIGEPFGNMPGMGSGSPQGFPSHSRLDEKSRFDFLPPHLRNREPSFGGKFLSHGFSKDSGPHSSDDLFSSDPAERRKPGSSGWCRICKIDCETVEGLDLHSQTREHQKVAMDIVLGIKKNSFKKRMLSSEDHISLGEINKVRMTSFDGRGNRP